MDTCKLRLEISVKTARKGVKMRIVRSGPYSVNPSGPCTKEQPPYLDFIYLLSRRGVLGRLEALVNDATTPTSGPRPRGRPQRHKGGTILFYALWALERTQTGLSKGPARWASNWGWPANGRVPSGSQCLRRLRAWQANGQWEKVIAELRLWAKQNPELAPTGSSHKDGYRLVVHVEQLAAAAELRRPPHKRPSRSRKCSKVVHEA